MTDAELERLAIAAKPRWDELQIAVAGNPNVAQRASDFLSMISPDTILALIARIKALLAEASMVLTPFANHAERYEPRENDDSHTAWSSEFRIGDLRRAAALKEKIDAAK